MTDQKGILTHIPLPDGNFDELWARIIVPEETKDKLLSQILLEFTVRREIPRGALPLHGLIILVGPPGTGKTSLAKGAASKAAAFLKGAKPTFIQVEPHGLTSSSLGRSQKDMHQFLNGTISEYAQQGPLIVLLDEVETLAVDRKKLSLDANPIDVHRATDAVLAALDHLAESQIAFPLEPPTRDGHPANADRLRKSPCALNAGLRPRNPLLQSITRDRPNQNTVS